MPSRQATGAASPIFWVPKEEVAGRRSRRARKMYLRGEAMTTDPTPVEPMRGRAARSLRFACMLLGATVLSGYGAGYGSAASGVPSHGIEGAPPPVWPMPVKAAEDAPNVLLILTDDIGFGASGTFGGPIPTPTFDALAAEGLRYNEFHVSALCSPTRAALLTGRNPHNAEMGNATNLPTGFEGYTTVIPKSAGSVAAVLSQNGYSTSAFGKWHLTPEWEQSYAGPFDHWPTGLGFDYFYGFIEHDTSQFEPALVENRTPIERPADDPDYHLDRDLADKARAWIREQQAAAPHRPFFIYYATGTGHAPHQAPKQWLAEFRGKFDSGWDVVRRQTFERQKAAGVIPADAVLPPRPAAIPAWSSLSKDQQAFAARLMEAHAAAVAHADYQIGRVIDAIRETGELDNTLIIYIQGDNGASAEGGIGGLLFEQSMINSMKEDAAYQMTRIDDIGSYKLYNTYPVGWAWAMNTPFRYYKRIASHLGGIRDGMVMFWPSHIKQGRGSVRSQFHYVSDIMPTILEAAHVEAPKVLDGVEQKSLDGISMIYTFDAPALPSRRHEQIFEMMENFGLYLDGWMAVSTPTTIPWAPDHSPKPPVDERQWELYDLRSDFTQAHDLAATHPEKLSSMQATFWLEAARQHILPIHRYTEGREGMPTLKGDRRTFVYAGPAKRIPASGAPSTIGRSYRIEASVTIPEDGGSGVIVTQGGRFGGYALYLKGGRLFFHYNALDPHQYTVSGQKPVPAGKHKFTAEFESDSAKAGSGGMLRLRIDGDQVAEGRIEQTIRGGAINPTEGLDIGGDSVSPVDDDYTIAGSRFSGDIDKVVITLE
ncbi:MAG: sulfatase-like hydrolase/transferase [Alphaproteobacteria bacterium]|nr:sulfatase-like hydrolase/transferase [Alphaproteobacteria bacterium]